MGRTYKDREKKGLPRVPKWARPRPEQLHKKDKKQDQQNKDREDDFPDYMPGRSRW